MPTCTINIDTLSAADAQQCRTGTYKKGNPFPGYAEMNDDGDIDLTRAQGNPSTDLEWTLPSAANVAFDATTPFSVDSNDGQFKDITPSNPKTPGGNDYQTLTVTDENNVGRFTLINYTLHLSDGTKIDPRVINR